jgi:hypothetical protein
MSGIHDAILEHVQAALQEALIDDVKDVDPADPAIAGVVCIGPLQDEPAPDVARISVTLHENDPDSIIAGSVSGLKGDWSDEVDEIEIGGAITRIRRFTCKARCLLANTAESLDAARSIASTIRDRIETTLLHLPFTGVTTPTEYCARGILSEELAGEMLQAGGPGSYDYYVKIRFSVLTTQIGVMV